MKTIEAHFEAYIAGIEAEWEVKAKAAYDETKASGQKMVDAARAKLNRLSFSARTHQIETTVWEAMKTVWSYFGG